MSRFFFSTSNGHRVVDHTGTDLVDDQAAEREAIRLTGALIADAPDILRESGELRVEVTDEHGRSICTVHVRCEN